MTSERNMDSVRPIEVNIDAKVVPPGGYVVATVPEDVSPEIVKGIAEQVRKKYPDLQMVFFSGGIEIEAVVPDA